MVIRICWGLAEGLSSGDDDLYRFQALANSLAMQFQ
jgi:hypothetical protein